MRVGREPGAASLSYLVNLDDKTEAGGWLVEELRSCIDKTELKFAVVVIGQDAPSLDFLGHSFTNGVGIESNPTGLEALSISAAEDSRRVSDDSLIVLYSIIRSNQLVG